jgi:two-component system alkaline phosphatase synthesis response regulator PhoP
LGKIVRRRKALVVDDDESVRLVLNDLLIHDGWDVVAIDDGSGVEDSLVEHRFDLIVLDLQMPGMNGFEVLRMLRRAGPEIRRGWRTAADVRVVALTGAAGAEGLAFAEKVGADATLAKPFELEDVRRVIAGL